MSVRFSVVHTVYLSSTNRFIVDGHLTLGKILMGDVLRVCDDPTKRVKVLGIGTDNARESSDSLSLLIEEPAFPLAELNGSELVSAEFVDATNRSSYPLSPDRREDGRGPG